MVALTVQWELARMRLPGRVMARLTVRLRRLISYDFFSVLLSFVSSEEKSK